MSSTRKVTITRRKPGQTGRKTTTRTSDSRRFAADKPAGRSPGLPRTTTSGSASCLPIRRNSGATRRDRYIGAAYSCGYSSGMAPAARTGFPVIQPLSDESGGMEPDKRIPKNIDSIARRRVPSQTKNLRRGHGKPNILRFMARKGFGMSLSRRILQRVRVLRTDRATGTL